MVVGVVVKNQTNKVISVYEECMCASSFLTRQDYQLLIIEMVLQGHMNDQLSVEALRIVMYYILLKYFK